jgi:hypothetical protein
MSMGVVQAFVSEELLTLRSRTSASLASNCFLRAASGLSASPFFAASPFLAASVSELYHRDRGAMVCAAAKGVW